MSLLSKGLLNFISPYHRTIYPVFGNQLRNAARKGTRERKQKKKVKVEEKKVGFIPKNIRDREKMLLARPKRKFDDSWKQISTDNVYINRYYQWKVYSFVEAIECHRETHHPEVYNQPNAPVQIIIELNMEGEKKTRFVDNFTRIAAVSHAFDHGEERSIIAFAKDSTLQTSTKEAGAALVGGVELIKEIQNGNVALQDFQFAIAHPNILPELLSLRGLMKKKFPNPKTGTLDQDLPGLVFKYLNGINYTAVKDEFEKDFGIIETTIGTLDMDAKHLEANFVSLIKDVVDARPKRPGSFISRCLVMSAPSREKFKVDHTIYVNDVAKPKVDHKKDMGVEENEVDEKEAVAV